MSDVEKIKRLRQSTGAGFKDCGIAIEEAKGDIDKAVEILRVKGISKASKKNFTRFIGGSTRVGAERRMMHTRER